MTSDFFLVQKIRNGDELAGNQFVEKYYSLIYQYCFLHIRNKECAEDMTQETFVRFYEAILKDANIRKIKNYLYSIAGNILKNYYKKKKEILLDQLPETEKDNLTELEIRLDIERALDQLPEEIKEITILFFFQGLKQKEIAALLHIKLSLVKYRISKAKELLSKQLEVGRE
ncbi:RNA polymerase sigma factor [Mediterraneibacter faecis]|uniref:RNA polymerase sigma factor n=1 Tax=Mediterraneibacter faecis TaxID=592978 RepID=UPI003F8B0DD5